MNVVAATEIKPATTKEKTKAQANQKQKEQQGIPEGKSSEENNINQEEETDEEASDSIIIEDVGKLRIKELKKELSARWTTHVPPPHRHTYLHKHVH